MARNRTLQQLETALQEAGYTTRYLPVDDDNRLEQLNVRLMEDAQGRAYYVELAFASAARRAMQASGELPAGQGDEPVDYLQFYVTLPFEVRPDRMGDAAQLVAYLNVQVPLVGFGLSHDQGRIFFRYMMLTKAQDAHPRLVTEAVDVIEFLIAEFGDALEAVASGSASLQQVINQL